MPGSKTSGETRLLDLQQDLPTTAEDVQVLHRLRQVEHGSLLVHVNGLRAPNWSREAAAARPTFAGCEPFEL